MKKTILAAALLTALLLIFAGCSNTNPNGSALPSASASASAVVANPSASPTVSALAVTVKGSDYVSALLTGLGTTYGDSNSGVTINTTATNSNTAIADVSAGKADIALSSRQLKTEEKLLFPDLKETLICKDGLAVVVSKDCPVNTLSAQQIREIFLGNVTNWKDVGGDDVGISVYAMGANTDTRKRFNEQFLGKEEGVQNDSISVYEASSETDMADTVGGEATAIGYMPLSAITADSNVKAITIDAVPADADNVKSGKYIYALNYYLITNNPSDAVQAFVDYCKGTEAQAAITGKGLIIP